MADDWRLTPCVETTRSRNEWGYGRITVMRFGKKINLDHRLAWIDANGCLPPDDKPYICHHCDNPPCINPDHLFAGSQTDNIRDAVGKGRLWQQATDKCPQGHTYDRLWKGIRLCGQCKRQSAGKYRSAMTDAQREIRRASNRRYNAGRRARANTAA